MAETGGMYQTTAWRHNHGFWICKQVRKRDYTLTHRSATWTRHDRDTRDRKQRNGNLRALLEYNAMYNLCPQSFETDLISQFRQFRAKAFYSPVLLTLVCSTSVRRQDTVENPVIFYRLRLGTLFIHFFYFPRYLQSVPIHSSYVVKSCRRVSTSTLLYLIGSGLLSFREWILGTLRIKAVFRWKPNDVSEDNAVRIFRIEKLSKQETSMKTGGK
jgi:hypothetical protein